MEPTQAAAPSPAENARHLRERLAFQRQIADLHAERRQSYAALARDAEMLAGIFETWARETEAQLSAPPTQPNPAPPTQPEPRHAKPRTGPRRRSVSGP